MNDKLVLALAVEVATLCWLWVRAYRRGNLRAELQLDLLIFAVVSLVSLGAVIVGRK